MKTVLAIVALAGTFVLAGAAVQQWADGNVAIAQSCSSACFQNCTNVRQWPAAQCRQYCKGRGTRKGM